MPEIWKPVKGFEGKYEVSSYGRIRSLDRVILRKSTKGLNYLYPLRGHLLSPSPTKDGYLAVKLGKKHTGYIHCLVAQGFIGPRPNGQVVRHIDGNCINNTLKNIAYGTRTDNINDAKLHGTWQKGLLKKRKLSDNQRQEIASLYAKGSLSLRRLAKRFGVGQTTVFRIKEDYCASIR